MKIIDLLNKIANEEENDLETEFEFDGKIWNFYKLNHSEYCLDVWLLNQNITITKHKEILQEKKIPEKLDVISWDKCIHGVTHKEKELAIEINKTQELLNQVIDYLKSEGE